MMWKQSLKESEYMGMTCVLSAPVFSELQIVHIQEGDADGWTVEEAEEVITKMTLAGLRGEIEVSPESFLAYLRSGIPEMTEEYFLACASPSVEFDFPERVQEVIEGIEKGEYESFEAELEAEAAQSGLRCEIDANSSESITDAQVAAIEFVLENEEGLCEIIAESLEDYYDGLDWDDEDDGALLDEEDRDITNCVSCDYVRVTAKEYQGMAYTEFQMQVIWDEEHRINVILHGDRVIDTLDSGGGWIDQENDEQVNRPVINPFTGKPIPKPED